MRKSTILVSFLLTLLGFLNSRASDTGTISPRGTANISDAPLSSSWNGSSTVAPTLNSTYNAILPAEQDVASAATVDLSLYTGKNIRITGTTGISSFGTAPSGSFTRGRFGGVLTLTHSSSAIILPGAANITTATGDLFWAVSQGSGKWEVWYQKADGTAVAGSGGTANLSSVDQITYNALALSGTNNTLSWNTNAYIWPLTANSRFSIGDLPASTNKWPRIHLVIVGGFDLTNVVDTIIWEPTYPGTVPTGTNTIDFAYEEGAIHGIIGWKVNATDGLIAQVSGTTTNVALSSGLSLNANTLSLKGFKQYLPFINPSFGDGIGAIPQTNDYTAATFMHWKFSGSAATNANYVVYGPISVPTDLNTAVDLRARLKVRLSATETSASTFNIGVQDVADSASGSFGGAGNWVAITISADAAGAANDIETSAWVTLTGWKSALTADHAMFIVLNRDGAGDAANTGIFDAEFKIEYTVNQ